MIERTFDASGETRVMIQEKHLDDQGRVTFERLFDEDGYTDREYTYNENGQQTALIERGEEGETYRKTFTYHSDGALAEETLWIGGEQYRRVEHHYQEGTSTTKIFEGDTQIEHRVTQWENDKPVRHDYYEEDELVETNLIRYTDANTTELQVLLGNGEPFARHITTHNDQDELLTLRRWQGESLLESIDQTFNAKGQLVRQTVGEYENSLTEYTLDYKYDAHGNLIEREWREQNSGQLIGFEHNRYDDQQRLIETVGKMHSVALGGSDSGEEHFVYTYEE